MLLDIFKKKEQKKENVEMIAIPDIRDYVLKGYDEIREVKQEKERIEKARDNYKKEAEDNKKLYDTTLIALNEFKKRDEENQSKIDYLKNELEQEKISRESDNKTNKNTINELKEQNLNLENKLKELSYTIEEDLTNQIIEDIKKTKGQLSKERVIKIIKCEEI